MLAVELRNLDEARRYVLQGLWLLRAEPPTAARVRPALEWSLEIAASGYLLPMVPSDGRIEVVFDAGFGAVWALVPPDLQQAVYLLASHYYEHRHEFAEVPPGLPYPVQALIERWRIVRVLGGGAA